jgi:hypothetical protein|tara:strand:- start:699 stop:935 length:237 start_codon:yes stop_codon:yes gene_type:complete
MERKKLNWKEKKIIIITIIYLITVNFIFPAVAYYITGTKKGMVKGYFYGAIVSVIFWTYFGYMLIKPKELWTKLTGKE